MVDRTYRNNSNSKIENVFGGRVEVSSSKIKKFDGRLETKNQKMVHIKIHRYTYQMQRHNYIQED